MYRIIPSISYSRFFLFCCEKLHIFSRVTECDSVLKINEKMILESTSLQVNKNKYLMKNGFNAAQIYTGDV